LLEDVSFVEADKVRLSILKALASRKTPKDLARIVGRPLPAVSRALRELKQRNLVVCLTPTRRKRKFYSLTDSGKQVLSEIRKESPQKTR